MNLQAFLFQVGVVNSIQVSPHTPGINDRLIILCIERIFLSEANLGSGARPPKGSLNFSSIIGKRKEH
jgi:hypothetical protein